MQFYGQKCHPFGGMAHMLYGIGCCYQSI